MSTMTWRSYSYLKGSSLLAIAAIAIMAAPMSRALKTCPRQNLRAGFSLVRSRNETGHMTTAFRLVQEIPFSGQPSGNVYVRADPPVVQHNNERTDTLVVILEEPPPASQGPPPGYSYYPEVGYYKIYEENVTWPDAKEKCERDGTHLAIINSMREAGVLREFIKLHRNLSPWIFIGFHDRERKGRYVTVFEQSLETAGFADWEAGQPDGAGNSEYCGSISHDVRLNDEPCSIQGTYICEYSSASEGPPPGPQVPPPSSHNPPPGYSYYPGVGYYKLYEQKATWSDAKKKCEREGTHLAIINSMREAGVLREFIKLHRNLSPSVFIGFHDPEGEGRHVTVLGETLENAGYAYWEPGQPDGANTCGSITHEARLNDESCFIEATYICEYSPDLPSPSQGPPTTPQGSPSTSTRPSSTTQRPSSTTSAAKQSPPVGYSHYPGAGYFKLYEERATWFDAKAKCEEDGAHLAVINSAREAGVLRDLIKRHNNVHAWVFVGFHDQGGEGRHITVFGQTLEEAGYAGWHPGQPDNAGNNEHCGSITHEGRLNDYTCYTEATYICEYTPDPPPELQGVPTGYSYYPGAGYFKLYEIKETWHDAKAKCEREGAHLAVINSEREAGELKELMKIHKNLHPWVFIGFHDQDTEGHHVTVFGQTLEEAGYAGWNPGQPDNAGKKEHCGSITHEGRLNDYPCSTHATFICEYTPDPPPGPKGPVGYSHYPGAGFFKLYEKKETWPDAKANCEREGAHLAVINSAREAGELRELMKLHKNLHPWVFIGYHDQKREGQHITVFGQTLEEAGYAGWHPGQPDNAGNNEHCGSITHEGRLNDYPCSTQATYICEYTPDLPRELQGVPTGYSYYPGAGYFKLYEEKKTWPDAKAKCEQDGAHLAVINSEREAEVLKELMKIHKNLHPWVFIGFHDQEREGRHITVFGQTLEEAGYAGWHPGQPDNAGNNEHCGSITHEGRLNDYPCSIQATYICEFSFS